MNRIEFTRAKTNLLAAMFLEGESPIEDYLKRSDEEQMRMFLKGLSKCDGVKIISAHQSGRAIDIYFMDPNTMQLCEPKRGWEFCHNYWEKKGGKPLIYLGPNKTKPDYPHFEG